VELIRRNSALFHLYLRVVSVYVGIYSLLFAYLGAHLTSAILLFCLVGLGVAYWLDIRTYAISARFAFIVLCVFSILSPCWGVIANLGTEWYFLAALVLPYPIFTGYKSHLPLIACALAPLGWALQVIIPVPNLSDFWILREFSYAPVFQVVSFLGSSAIIAIFLATYARYADRYRRTHEMLRATKIDLEEAQAVARMGSWSFDVQTRKITWSKQMYEIFGADPAKGPPLFEQHIRSLHPDDQQPWRDQVEQCCRDGQPFKMRFRNVLPNRTVWVETAGRGRVNSNGVVFQLNGTSQDVTEVLQTEKEAKAERSKSIHRSKLASLGEMAAGVAHEINNPVAVISGAVALMPKHFGNPEELTRRLAMIDRACQRIAKIVSGLKKFSRSPDASEFRVVNLADILTEAISLTLPRSQRHGVELTYTCLVKPLIDCDEIEIEQVIIILVNNAIDAVKDSVEPWVNVALIEEGGSAVLRITDSGTGIDPKVAAKLFEPFFTTKSAGNGTGLGLSIAKGILQDHKATIELVDPKPNTCFEIRFPLASKVTAPQLSLNQASA
jgi:signal transduction histidine kinase